MMVRFDCGCLGIVGIQGDEQDRPLIIYPCDLNDPDCWEPIGLYRRDQQGKGHTPLSAEKTAELLREMSGLLADGYRFRRVKSLLNGP
ncbi:hypothetical protein N9917_03460 [Deltaproteobacteria bacterium]|nr:hypothetical protein [Deltaproteobacteria bacterium]